MDAGQTAGCLTENVDCGDTLVCKGNAVGGIDVLPYGSGEALFLCHIVNGVNERFLARDTEAILAEYGSRHVDVYAETDIFKKILVRRNVCLAAEKSALFRAAPDESDCTAGRIFHKVTIHFKYRDGACAVIKHAAAERNGIVMGGINDDFVREFRAFDFRDNVAGVGFALLLLKRYANGFCAAFNHSLCVVYMNADCGENAFFRHRRTEHTLVKIVIALFIAEVACHADERERTCLYELFKSVCIDAAGEENDFSLYPAKIDFVKSVNINELSFDAVLCGVAGKAVARDFIFLFEGSEHFEF